MGQPKKETTTRDSKNKITKKHFLVVTRSKYDVTGGNNDVTGGEKIRELVELRSTIKPRIRFRLNPLESRLDQNSGEEDGDRKVRGNWRSVRDRERKCVCVCV